MYYNEFDPFAARWLRNLMANGLIPEGTVDERSIKEVDGVDGATAHFFAGIGGWPYALQLAGWPVDRPVWTGSCPCQPFSAAGKRKGEQDERHLWPEFFRLIRQHRPATIFGEQVASHDGLRWLDGVFADLEGAGYACGASDLCAYWVGANHKRQRIFFVANSSVHGRKRLRRCVAAQIQEDWPFEALDAWHGTGNPFEHWRKLLAGSCVRRMDDGISSCLAVRPTLRCLGNAIVPQLAALFVRAFMGVERGCSARDV